MVNDTEPANTGQNTTSCVSLHSVLGKPLLWASCRHHIGEVVVERVFTDGLKMEVSKSPYVAIFDRFKSVYHLLPHSDIKVFDFPTIDQGLTDKVHEIVDLCTKVLPKPFIRGDYKELLQLNLLYFKGKDFERFEREKSSKY